MDEFKSKLDTLCYKYKKAGNSKQQLNQALLKSVGKKNCCGQVKKVVCRVFACLVVIVLAVSLACYLNEDVEFFVMANTVMPMMYPSLKLLRLVSLPISRRFDLTGYYEGECIWRNPYFQQVVGECAQCENVHKFLIFDKMPSTFTDVQVGESETGVVPQIYKKGATPVSLKKFIEVCNSDLVSLSDGIHDVVSPLGLDFAGLKRMMAGDELMGPKISIEWRTQMIGPARVLRQMYKRPTFIDVSHELHVDKSVIIDGVLSGVRKIELFGTASAAYYIQSAGCRKLTLSPAQMCKKQCKPISIVLRAGDMMHFDYNYGWELSTDRVEGCKESSLAYIQSYKTG